MDISRMIRFYVTEISSSRKKKVAQLPFKVNFTQENLNDHLKFA